MIPFMEINLLPYEERKIKKDYTFLLDARLVVPVIVLALSWSGTRSLEAYLGNKLEAAHGTLTALKQDLQSNKEVAGQITKIEEMLKEKKGKNLSLKNIQINQHLWVQLLEEFSLSLPPASWLDGIQLQGSKDTIQLSGSTYQFSEVSSYMVNLQKSSIFSEIKLENVQKMSDKKPEYYRFSFRMTLSPSVIHSARNDLTS